MAGALLRSESLKSYHALGALGTPVFRMADQIRGTLARRAGREAAESLAIPKQSEAGDRIDWYAPAAGEVVPWSSATEEERADAISRLATLRGSMASISEAFRESSSEDGRTFSRLLALSHLVPSEDHLYLVDGKPVVTFWGFSTSDHPEGRDVLRGLRADAPAAPVAAPAPASGPGVVAPAAVLAATVPWWRRLLPWLLLLLLLLLLLFGLRYCTATGTLPDQIPRIPGVTAPGFGLELPAPEPVIVVPETTLPSVPGVGVPGVGVPGVGVPGGTVPADTLPDAAPGADLPGTSVPEGAVAPPPAAQPEEKGQDAPATPDAAQPPPDAKPEPPVPPVPEPDTKPEPPPTPPADQAPPADPATPPLPQVPPATPDAGTMQPMTIPEKSVEDGNVDFLNGQWRSKTSLLDARTKQPVQVDYVFDKGKGRAEVTLSDGTKCSAPAEASMQGGALVIRDKEAIRCPNGSTYAPSTVRCVPRNGGRAECRGSYSGGSGYDVTIGR